MSGGVSSGGGGSGGRFESVDTASPFERQSWRHRRVPTGGTTAIILQGFLRWRQYTGFRLRPQRPGRENALHNLLASNHLRCDFSVRSGDRTKILTRCEMLALLQRTAEKRRAMNRQLQQRRDSVHRRSNGDAITTAAKLYAAAIAGGIGWTWAVTLLASRQYLTGNYYVLAAGPHLWGSVGLPALFFFSSSALARASPLLPATRSERRDASGPSRFAGGCVPG